MLQLKNTTFGIPNTKELKTIQKEPYADEPVFSLIALDTTKTKVVRKMSFNTTAMKTVDIETTEANPTPNVIFISEPHDMYVMKINEINNSSILVNKKGSINNKNYYEFIAERFELDVNKDNHFKLIPVEAEGVNNEIITVYQLQLISDIVENTSEETLEVAVLEEEMVGELVTND